MCSSRYADFHQPARPAANVYVHPGFVQVAQGEALLTTLVGSCVAVACWDAFAGFGGMNHFLLPQGPGGPRFAEGAIDELVSKLEACGARRVRLRAKIFGGACVLEAFRGTEGHIGARNVKAARELLSARGVPLVDEEVGGERGRKVVFRAGDGDALVRLV